jgi:dihydroorotate dehydrogenase (fumarate)
MIDLATTWLGLQLTSPLVVGACPLSDDLDSLRACVAAGAGAVVMHSLFEEQLVAEQIATFRSIEGSVATKRGPPAPSPEPEPSSMGSQDYLTQLELLCTNLPVPVVASLNGVTPGGWTERAVALEEAGAAAIELNLYEVATGMDETATTLEQRQLDVVRAIVEQVSVPVSVKLTPYYSALPAFVHRLQDCGARGVVLFNRFYQPDVDLDTLKLRRDITLSTRSELLLRLHAMAALYGNTNMDIALSGGVHEGDDVAKAILCGANVVQVVSAILQQGPDVLTLINNKLQKRLSTMGYYSLQQARGMLSLRNAPNPKTWERLNYARLLQAGKPQGSDHESAVDNQWTPESKGSI